MPESPKVPEETVSYRQQVVSVDCHPEAVLRTVPIKELETVGDLALRAALERKVAAPSNLAVSVVAKIDGSFSHSYYVLREPRAVKFLERE